MNMSSISEDIYSIAREDETVVQKGKGEVTTSHRVIGSAIIEFM